MRALERRDVDRVDALVAQALAEQLGLLLADRIERRIAVTVAQREGPAGTRRRRLAVTHEQDRRRARRRGESVLAKPFGADRRRRSPAEIMVPAHR